MSTDGSSKSQSAITSSSFPKSMENVEFTHSGSNSSILKSNFQSSGNIAPFSLIQHTDHKPNGEVVMASQSNCLEGAVQLHSPKQQTNKPFGQRAKKSFPKPRFKVPQQVLGKDATNPEIEVVQYVTKSNPVQESNPCFTVPNVEGVQHAENMLKLNEEFISDSLKKEIPEDEASELCKTSHLPHRSNTSCEPTSGQATINNSSPIVNTQPLAESRTSSRVVENEVSLTVQSTPGPSSVEVVNGEEMTVTSTTTSPIVGGLPIDEEHRKSILASMKQAYTSELNQSEKTLRSEKQLNLDDPTGMPSLTALSPSIRNNEGPSDIDVSRMPVLEMNADDSFDEELNCLGKKSRFSSPDSKTDFGMESQEDVFSENNTEPIKKVAVATTPVDLSHRNVNPVQNNNSGQQLSDLQDVHHPPTPAPTPQTDDLEAAMAALHGEPLDPDSAETDITMTKIPLTNLGDPKIRMNQANISDHSADSDYQPDSGNVEVSSDEVEESKPPMKPYKYHKIGPKSRTKPASKPPKLCPIDKATGGASYEAKDETKQAVEIKAHPRLSREVEKLCADEMVNNILRSMEEQGSSRRRSSQAVVTYKEYQSNNSEKDLRASRRTRRVKEEEHFERESTPPKKKKKARTNSIPSPVESIPQDRALQQWEALQNSNNENRVIYVPRKLVNPADASKIVHRRSFSSASSTDDNQNNNRKAVHPQDGPEVQSASYALKKDHCYTTMKNDIPEPGSSQRDTEDLAAKLSASCKEIHIRCKDHLLYVILCPRTSKLRNSLNSSILKELSVLLRKLKMEPQIHVVLFTSAGPDFCTGVDFPSLIHDNMASRLEASISLVNRIQEFITELANCDKILVGGLVGSVIGLGVTMLPYMDLVYACDKTTFYLPYVKLGQSSEGGLPLTLPSTSKNLLNLLVHEGRRLTATQAKSFGLVDDVFLPDSFQEEMIPRVINLAILYSQNSLPIKRMSRAALRRDLPAVLKEESQLLRQSWISEDFQRRAKQLFDSGDLLSA